MYVNPGQVVDDMQIEVAVRESREITEIDAMTRVLDNDIYTGMALFVYTFLLYCLFVFFYHNTDLIIIIYCDIPLYNGGTHCRGSSGTS